jgi:rhodanese-related sulfurtransferase
MNLRRTLIDAFCIILAGTLFGLVWNRSILFHPNTETPQPPAAAENAPLPAPAPLQQVKELFDARQALFVDARNADTFRKEHIPGAVPLPAEELDKRLPEFRKAHPPGRTVIVYCNGAGCPDSMEVARALMRERYTDVLVFEGGMPEWREAGYPREGEEK